MNNKIPKSGFQLSLDEEASKKLLRFLEDEGLMQAAFEARESGGRGGRSLKIDISEVLETDEDKDK